MKLAYYSSSISKFLSASPESILGAITNKNAFDVTPFQRDAWIEQTKILKRALAEHSGRIYLEFSIPRMGKRIDALVIIGPVIFVIEFKIGESKFLQADIDQVTDYALDLHNFHEGSHTAIIAPILVASRAKDTDSISIRIEPQSIIEPFLCNSETLKCTIDAILDASPKYSIDIVQWENSRYKPTPTIIEATLALYNGHSVADISRSDASAYNLTVTSEAITKIIKRSREHKEKSLILVTGVPGAGKTLVGLNIAAMHLNTDDDLYSVYLSGNGPLVRILQEALARDKVARKRANNESIKKNQALSEAKAFIQNVHHFRDECLINQDKPPVEHIALFDEAQRAWTKEQTEKFMRQRKNVSGFCQSEPEFLISCLDRHPDWACVIGLVGGGQEINTGEAGIKEWLIAANRSFQHWNIYLSNKLTDEEYGANEAIRKSVDLGKVHFLPELHLNTSVRSFRSESVSEFVKLLLDIDICRAKDRYLLFKDKFPIVLTRDLDNAKDWLRNQARGTERYGIVVSSQAVRLKPYAIDVRVKPDPVHWFLNGKDDIRSSYYLEDVVTEFDIQGLELDWVCVAWDADFRFRQNQWEHWSFRGNRWQKIRKMERQIYQKNAYRVLLTRARQGMVIFIPTGSNNDPTRAREFYDSTYNYLKSIGLPEI